jgi:hypothetical protein
MGGKEESEMRGLSVFFIVSILPILIKDLGDIYGHFCGSNFCGRNAKDCPGGPRVHEGVTCDASGMNPIVGTRFHKIGEDYDLCEAEFAKLSEADKALFEKIGHVEDPKGPLSPEDARPYDVDKPLFREKSKAQTCPRDGLPGCAFVDHVHTVRPSPRLLVHCTGARAPCLQTYGGEHTGRATIMLSYTWGYTFGAIGSALMAFCAKHGLDPRTTHVWICCICINQHRVAGGRRELHMLTLGGESSAALAQARR